MGQFIKWSLHLFSEVEKLRKEGKRIVVMGGVWDLINQKHLRLFRIAKSRGGGRGVLLLNVLNDKRVMGVKKLSNRPELLVRRPINSEIERAGILAGLETVDLVTIHPPVEFSPTVALVGKIRPYMYIVEDKLPAEEQKYLRRACPQTKVVVEKYKEKNCSTTLVINRIIRRYLEDQRCYLFLKLLSNFRLLQLPKCYS